MAVRLLAPVCLLSASLLTCVLLANGTDCNDTDIRLVNGTNEYEGRVEICIDGQWGTVCSSEWDPNAAAVVCRQLGALTNNSLPIAESGYFGEGAVSVSFHLDEPQCNGSELQLTDCSYHNSTGPCAVDEDAGVICRGFECESGSVRLVNGSEPASLAGRVEVCIGGVWGTACNENWDYKDAMVTCRDLETSTQYAFTVIPLEFGPGRGPIFQFNCNGSESHLLECNHAGVNVHDCGHEKDAVVMCGVEEPECTDTDVRLVGGHNALEGVLEICFSGLWGSVCRNGWDDVDAGVVCGQLGFSQEDPHAIRGAGLIYREVIDSEEARLFLLSEVNCHGDEANLADCIHLGVNVVPDCVGLSRETGFYEAGVTCHAPAPAQPTSESSSTSGPWLAIGGALGGFLFLTVSLIILVTTIFLCAKVKSRRSKANSDANLADEKMYIHMDPLPIRDQYKHWRLELARVTIESSQVKLLDILGEGHFGKVYKGTLSCTHNRYESNTESPKVKEVAVKNLKSASSEKEIDQFISESAIMAEFDHPNILKLLGVCFDTENGLPLIILPFMANGDLRTFLSAKKQRTTSTELPKGLNISMLMSMCLDIAKGMEYLTQKKFVHRDLAARNCMVDRELVVKVADFGLSRDVYSTDYYCLTHHVPLPVKWLPPESLHNNIYNEKTDVWSFGVVCWEVFSMGNIPYPGVDNYQIPDYIDKGHRPKKPKLCPQNMHDMMLTCWDTSPERRPPFTTLVQILSSGGSQEITGEYYVLAAPNAKPRLLADEAHPYETPVLVSNQMPADKAGEHVYEGMAMYMNSP